MNRCRGLVTSFGILCQAGAHELFQPWRHAATSLTQRRHIPTKNRLEHAGAIITGKRLAPARHLVQHCSKREDVRSLIDRPAVDLLGSHVRSRAEDGTVLLS